MRQVFAGLSADSCPLRYNFHLHTQASDGQLHPHQVIDQALSLGLRGLAITDHHTVRGYLQARDYLAQHPEPGLHLWSGIEINAYLFDTEVHILGYGFDPAHPALEPFLQPPQSPTAAEVTAALHQAGGLVVLAHPYRYNRAGAELIAAAADLGMDGIEAFYNYKNPDPWYPSPEQTQAALDLAQRYGLLTTCGTDSHGTSITRRI
ncbi:MAG: PHP domain-containing protein [Thermostichales cyanobacterium BF3_bins_165]